MLMDMFYEGLRGWRGGKRRSHYNEFMVEVHDRLHRLQGSRTERPLERVAADLVAGAQLICLDEFQVVDVADAMILRNLLAGLYARNAVLLLTSNRRPSELYANGLQRQSFLPCISLINDHFTILALDGTRDYREAALDRAAAGAALCRLYAPIGAASKQRIDETFKRLTQDMAGRLRARSPCALLSLRTHCFPCARIAFLAHALLSLCRH